RAHPNRDPNKTHVLLLSVAGPDGKQLTSLNRSNDRTAFASDARAASLAGVWSGVRAATGLFVLKMANHPLTEKGRAARAEFREAMSPAAQCIAWPSPFILAATDLYLTKIEMEEQKIVFRSEFYNTERVIYMDGREHPSNGRRTVQGHSIGHWE